jgi:hypothetical protein
MNKRLDELAAADQSVVLQEMRRTACHADQPGKDTRYNHKIQPDLEAAVSNK